jgi:hypothetical protein
MNSSDGLVLRYGPSRRLAIAFAVLAGAAAIAALLADAATGRLLLSCAAVVLAAVAAIDIVFSPRLTATAAGLAVFAPTQRTRLRWDEVDELRVDEHSHRGLAARTLEIESGDLLVVLSRRSLGCDPRDALAQLIQLRDARTL